MGGAVRAAARSGLVLALLAGACRSTGGVLREGVARAPDGVRIAYDVRGQGEPALVFVHCWCGNRSFWRGQLDALAEDHRVVALDLPGHGASGHDRERWTVTGLAADVQAVCDELGLERFVLVGHSMGGPVSLAAAARMPGRVLGIVAVDTLHDAEYRWPEDVMRQVAEGFERDFAIMMSGFLASMFPPDTDLDSLEWLYEEAMRTDQVAALALFRDFSELDLPALLRGAGVPIRAINHAPESPIVPPTAIATNRKYADYDAVLMTGVGHFLQIDRPEEFNAHLRAWVAEIARGR